MNSDVEATPSAFTEAAKACHPEPFAHSLRSGQALLRVNSAKGLSCQATRCSASFSMTILDLPAAPCLATLAVGLEAANRNVWHSAIWSVLAFSGAGRHTPVDCLPAACSKR